MCLPTSLEELLRHQARAGAVAARSLALLAEGGPDAIRALSQARWEAMRILREYQIYKHFRIFDPMIEERSLRSLPAKRMKAECATLGDAFVAHSLKWSSCSIDDHWPEYRRTSEAMIAAILRHLERERQGVASLLALPDGERRAHPGAPLGPPGAYGRT